MHIEAITNFQALGFALALLGCAWLLFHILPGVEASRGTFTYSDAEIGAYDHALPKYFIAGALALSIGGIHAVLKNLPPVFVWLVQSGYAGHMVRDLSNTHLVIVVGGTVTATGLTWYVLPRIVGRPLWSDTLASVSFWCTVLGATGFYVVHLTVGLLVGAMSHGWTNLDAMQTVGVWAPVLLALTAMVMGVGYWTFVADVLLTIRAARHVARGPDHRHLTGFFAIGAVGLFIGTVQGVLQVLPGNVAWLHAAGPAGRYIDPISHAHVNLVTGTLSLVAGIAFFLAAETRMSPARRRAERLVFWILVPGSLAFYLTFLGFGLYIGSLTVNTGVPFATVVAELGWRHNLPFAVAGCWTLGGVWFLLAVLVIWFSPRPRGDELAGAALIRSAAAVLVLGTLQGLVQLVPAVQRWLQATGPAGEAVANAHAQLNMLGGILVALLGLAFSAAQRLWGVPVPVSLVSRVRLLVVSGALLYWAADLGTALRAGIAIGEGRDPVLAMASVGPLGPSLMALGALLYTVGFGLTARCVLRATAAYRRDAWLRVATAISQYDGQRAHWRRHVPSVAPVAAEAIGAMVGFPGIGWILAGRPAVGLPLALIGPEVAWGVIPVMMSPFGSGALTHSGVHPLLLYLVASSASSLAVLGVSLAREQRHQRQSAPEPPLGAVS